MRSSLSFIKLRRERDEGVVVSLHVFLACALDGSGVTAEDRASSADRRAGQVPLGAGIENKINFQI
jgi:hypothetical protein